MIEIISDYLLIFCLTVVMGFIALFMAKGTKEKKVTWSYLSFGIILYVFYPHAWFLNITYQFFITLKAIGVHNEQVL